MSYLRLEICHQVGRYLISSVGLLGAGLFRYAQRLTSIIWPVPASVSLSPSANTDTVSSLHGEHDSEQSRLYPAESPGPLQTRFPPLGTRSFPCATRSSERTIPTHFVERTIPTHFVAIQVTERQIHDKMKMVQEDIVAEYPEYCRLLIPLKNLHITLMVMELDDEAEEAKAVAVLKEACKSLRKSEEKLVLTFQGIDSFNDRVVFVKMAENEDKRRLHRFTAEVRRAFQESGMPHTDANNDFTPHLTLMKLSRAGRPYLRKNKIRKINRSAYKHHTEAEFGNQAAMSVQICEMCTSVVTGYYEILHEELL